MLNFHLISPQNFSQDHDEIMTMFLANMRGDFVFFLVSSGFRLETLPQMPFLLTLFLTVGS